MFERNLQSIVNDDGGISSPEHVVSLIKLMRSETGFENQSLLWTVILSTKAPASRKRIVELDGAAILEDWLQRARKEAKLPFIKQLLKVLECLPITLEALQGKELGKLVKLLKKYPDQEVSSRADRLMNSWTQLVTATTPPAGGTAAPSSAPAAEPMVADTDPKKRSR